MSVKAWCQQEGYSSKTYYRWEREVLGLASEQLSRTETALQIQPNSMTPVFEETPVPAAQIQAAVPQIMASVRVGKSSIEVYQGANADMQIQTCSRWNEKSRGLRLYRAMGWISRSSLRSFSKTLKFWVNWLRS